MSISLVMENLRHRPHQPISLPQPLEVAQLPTPALVLNRPALERNIAAMAAFLKSHGKGFRPHAKTHKCPLICHLQMQAGAVGVCVAKPGEAVAHAAAGVDNILITSPVTTSAKAEIIAELAQQITGLTVVVDSVEGVDALTGCLEAGTDIGVLIDLDGSDDSMAEELTSENAATTACE